MQVTSALQALANGGIRMQPHIVQTVKDRLGNVVEAYAAKELGRVVSLEAAQQVTRYMTAVTREGGTGTKAAIEGYSVAGKTGTAQKVDPVLRRYGPGQYTSSFIGFLPAEDPRLVIVAVMDEPRGGQYYGGTVAGPVFAEVARAGMRLMGISPTVPLVEATGVPRAGSKLVARVTVPQGEVADNSADQDIPELKPVTASDEGPSEAFVLPDFTGQPMRRVLDALSDKLIALNVTGSGLVVNQLPRAGETIRSGELVTVVFSQDGPADARKKAN
jgi:cell division protein FtsI (penicillin-binding protein 3)